MKRVLSFLCLLFLLSPFCGRAFASTLLRLGHIAEPGSPCGQGAVYFANLVWDRSGGAIEVGIFSSGELGNEQELLEGLMTGSVDMALVGTSVLGKIIPEVSVFDLPYFFRNTAHARKALDTIGMDLCLAGKSHGIHALAMWESGLRHMTNNVRPIRSVRDMRGLRLCVMEDSLSVETMLALAAAPTPLPIGDVYTALEKGVVDGEEMPLAHIVTKRLHTVQRYLSLTGHSYSAEVLLMGNQAWKKLSPEDQDLIGRAASDAKIWERELCHALDGLFLKTVIASGCAVNRDVDRESMAGRTRAVWKIYEERFGSATIKAIIERTEDVLT